MRNYDTKISSYVKSKSLTIEILKLKSELDFTKCNFHNQISLFSLIFLKDAIKLIAN